MGRFKSIIGDQLRARHDMRGRMLYGPEAYFNIPEPYRIWLWPDGVQRAIGMLNLVPVQELTN